MPQRRDYPFESAGSVSRFAAFAGLALAASAPQVMADETHARELLIGMSDYLAAQTDLSFDVDTSVQIVTTDGQKLTIASSGSVALQRPDKIHVLRQGGFATIEMVFDGKTLSVLNRDANLYGQAPLPGSVDHLVETLRNRFHHALPGADLLGTNVAGVLLADVTAITDLGSGVIRGQECNHFAFRTDQVDWQIWIAQGDVPHPCRFVISSKSVEGWPEYTMEFSGWGNGTLESAFTFDAPEGATKVAIPDIPDLDEVSGIFVVAGVN